MPVLSVTVSDTDLPQSHTGFRDLRADLLTVRAQPGHGCPSGRLRHASLSRPDRTPCPVSGLHLHRVVAARCGVCAPWPDRLCRAVGSRPVRQCRHDQVNKRSRDTAPQRSSWSERLQRAEAVWKLLFGDLCAAREVPRRRFGVVGVLRGAVEPRTPLWVMVSQCFRAVFT